MDLYVDDDGFVRAPTPLVYRRLTDIGSWQEWWPGVALERLPDPEDLEEAETWAMSWRRGLTRLQFRAVAHAWRHEAGFQLSLSGDLTGGAEFWLEPGYGGTVVHHVLVGTTARSSPLRVLRAYRQVLRRGLWAFKDRVQAEVRDTLGLHP